MSHSMWLRFVLLFIEYVCTYCRERNCPVQAMFKTFYRIITKKLLDSYSRTSMMHGRDARKIMLNEIDLEH